jgi:hypothetical protein
MLQILKRGQRVLGLHAQENDVVRIEFQGLRVSDNPYPEFRRAIRRNQSQTASLHHPGMLTAGNQNHVVSLLKQSRTDGPANTPGSVNNESH